MCRARRRGGGRARARGGHSCVQREVAAHISGAEIVTSRRIDARPRTCLPWLLTCLGPLVRGLAIESDSMDAPPVLPAAGGQHPVISMFSAFFWLFRTSRFPASDGESIDVLWYTGWLLSWTRAAVTFSTISVPKFLYSVVSYSLTLTARIVSTAFSGAAR